MNIKVRQLEQPRVSGQELTIPTGFYYGAVRGYTRSSPVLFSINHNAKELTFFHADAAYPVPMSYKLSDGGSDTVDAIPVEVTITIAFPAATE